MEENAMGKLLIALIVSFSSSVAFASDKSDKRPAVGRSSTNIDFGETMIDGKMQAPVGFFLQGRSPQALSQMVKLRSHFKNELYNSKSAVRALVK